MHAYPGGRHPATPQQGRQQVNDLVAVSCAFLHGRLQAGDCHIHLVDAHHVGTLQASSNLAMDSSMVSWRADNKAYNAGTAALLALQQPAPKAAAPRGSC